MDARTGITVVHILERFFDANEAIVIFIIDNADKKHAARNRLFDKWHKSTEGYNIEKFDEVIELPDNETILAGLLVHTNNRYKETAIDEFYALIAKLKKEI